MRLVVDMNLSPAWVQLFTQRGWVSIHWSEIGPGNAADVEILRWARENHHVVVTQDLDFTQLLFSTHDTGPSVVLLRIAKEFDADVRDHVLAAMAAAEPILARGALLNVGDKRVRVRRLPIRTDS